MKNSTIEKPETRVSESLPAIATRIKRNIGDLEKVARLATLDLRRKIGADLMLARDICKKRKILFGQWMKENVPLSETECYNAIKIANSGSKKFGSVTEAIRHHNPSYAMPRVSVSEADLKKAYYEDDEENHIGRKILGGISTGIFLERSLSEAKEKGLKKKIALEMVDAGFRALSFKAHSDKGGSDESMRRLNEVRKAIKEAVVEDEIYFS